MRANREKEFSFPNSWTILCGVSQNEKKRLNYYYLETSSQRGPLGFDDGIPIGSVHLRPNPEKN
jgi:hypothetical protein